MALEYFNTVFAFAVVMLLLSLVITILVQIVVAVGGLRGRNLIWGVTKVLERSPALQKHVDKIAKAALQHPTLTPTGKTAKVIGSKELLAVLHDLANSQNTSLEEEAKDALTTALKGVVPQEAQYHAERLAKEFKQIFPNEASKMDEALHLMQEKVKRLAMDFDTWFDTVMNRSTDRFVARTRVWSVVFAAVLAVGLQIDSFELLKNLSTDAELRAALIQSADQTLSRANEVLLAKSVAVESLESVRDQFKDEWKANEPKDKEIPSSLVSRAQGLGWLKDEFKDSKKLADMQAAYEKRFDELTPERLTKLGNQMLEVKTQLQESRLVVLPADRSAYCARWKNVLGHLPGIFMSVLLLSLGAPFWFNALRTLASLRPILAGKTDPSKAEKA